MVNPYLGNIDSSVNFESSAQKLPAEHASNLFNLTMKGDINGIFEQLDKLEQMDTQFMPLIQQIRQLANDFKIREIREFVRQYM